MKKICLLFIYYLTLVNLTFADAGFAGYTFTPVIGQDDSVIFDFQQAICNQGLIEVPVFIISDDPVFALDFEIKFNPSVFSYNSFYSYKPYLNSSMNYHPIDSTLRFSSFSMIPIETNSNLIAIYFNLPFGELTFASFDSVRTWLNGDECIFGSRNLPIAPQIFTNGITELMAGDSLLLNINVPAGYTGMWSNGSTGPFTWVFGPGNYTVNLINASGCMLSSSIVITSINPLPVALLSFNAEPAPTGVLVSWITLTEINNDYFILERSTDALYWRMIHRNPGVGNSNNPSYYEFLDVDVIPGINYYRLKQYDFDNRVMTSEPIKVLYDLSSEMNMEVYPNPVIDASIEQTLIFRKYQVPGVLYVMDITGRVYLSRRIEGVECLNETCKLNFKTSTPMSSGMYYVKCIWNDSTEFALFIVN